MEIFNTKQEHNYVIYLGTACLVVGVSFTILTIVNEEARYGLTKEDGFFESLGSIGWLIASIVFFNIFRKDRTGNNLIFFRTKRNLVFCILAMFCLISFGEEISWGQRIFKLQTPEFLMKINRQGETNLHNIAILQDRFADGEDLPFWVKMLSMTKFFQAFWFGYCVFLPLMSRFSRRIYSYLKQINVPLIPVGLSVVFLANYLISRIIPLIDGMGRHSNEHFLVEIKEFNFGILFMLVSFYFLLTVAKDKTIQERDTINRYELGRISSLVENQIHIQLPTSNILYETEETQALPNIK